MNADGTEQTRLTDNPANDFGPEWKPGNIYRITTLESQTNENTNRISILDSSLPYKTY